MTANERIVETETVVCRVCGEEMEIESWETDIHDHHDRQES